MERDKQIKNRQSINKESGDGETEKGRRGHRTSDRETFRVREKTGRHGKRERWGNDDRTGDREKNKHTKGERKREAITRTVTDRQRGETHTHTEWGGGWKKHKKLEKGSESLTGCKTNEC